MKLYGKLLERWPLWIPESTYRTKTTSRVWKTGWKWTNIPGKSKKTTTTLIKNGSVLPQIQLQPAKSHHNWIHTLILLGCFSFFPFSCWPSSHHQAGGRQQAQQKAHSIPAKGSTLPSQPGGVAEAEEEHCSLRTHRELPAAAFCLFFQEVSSAVTHFTRLQEKPDTRVTPSTNLVVSVMRGQTQPDHLVRWFQQLIT